ncbi:MAG: hypothetical protein MUC93_06320 [Bacteroidales bacterium]|nr:hypothetical protein [Bacteroidales bacterium]
MNNKLLLLAFTLLVSATTIAQEKLTADNEKTTLSWLGEKVTGRHNGTINLQNGWLDKKENKIVSGEFTIDMTTIKDSEGSSRKGEIIITRKMKESGNLMDVQLLDHLIIIPEGKYYSMADEGII